MDRYRVDCQDHYDLEETPDGWLVMYDDVAESVADAVAAEREACAKVAEAVGEEYRPGADTICNRVAERIRERSNA